MNSDCSRAPGLQEPLSPQQGLAVGRYLNKWLDGCLDGWLVSMKDPDIRNEFQKLRKEKVHLYPVPPLGQVLHLMSHNLKSNPMIHTF